jgi:choline-glycine betaine transporter
MALSKQTKEDIKTIALSVLIFTQVFSLILIIVLVSVTKDLRDEVINYKENESYLSEQLKYYQNYSDTVPRAYFEQEISAYQDQLNECKSEDSNN